MNNTSNQTVRYELPITAQEAAGGISKILVRNGKRLEVNIPSGVTDGSQVKLDNARQVTDGQPGDIIIKIKIKGASDNDRSDPAEIVEITDADFDQQVLNSDLPVLVDFWASWCGPCLSMASVMEKAAGKYQGRVKFCKLNVDENPQSAARYKAMSIPMFLFFKGGNLIDKSMGAIPLNQMNQIIERVFQLA